MSQEQDRADKPLTIREFIKKPIVLMFLLISGLGTLLGTFNDAKVALHDYWPELAIFSPELNIRFDRDSAKAGETLALYYDLPDNGYFSLWNKNGSGSISRFYPPGLNHSTALNRENKTGTRYLMPESPNTEEKVIVLWSKKQLADPPDNKYKFSKQFDRYLQGHKSYNIKTKMIPVQITD